MKGADAAQSPSSRFDDPLTKLYVEQGLLDANRSPIHLPTTCPKCEVCWAGAGHRAPAVGEPASHVTPPWVGTKYSEGGLLVLLMNLNGYGGWDLGADAVVGMRHLARHACVDFAQGRRRLFGGTGYRGTMVWTQAVSYAAVWKARMRGESPAWEGERISGAALADTMDGIAISQHVKCSPNGEQSAPTPAMWTSCGAHVLGKELEVLRPSRIVVVGTGWNIWGLREYVLPGDASGQRERRIAKGRRTFTVSMEVRQHDGATVDLLIVPHPAAPGGNSGDLLRGADQVIEEACGVRRASEPVCTQLE